MRLTRSRDVRSRDVRSRDVRSRDVRHTRLRDEIDGPRKKASPSALSLRLKGVFRVMPDFIMEASALVESKVEMTH